MGERECDLSPLHFADALVRAEIGLSAIGLEINLGYWPGGTALRDVLELGRQIDRWSLLGMPLLITLTLPSAAGRRSAGPLPGPTASLCGGRRNHGRAPAAMDRAAWCRCC